MKNLIKTKKAYAKINVALQICGTLPDGYHSLKMLNLPLSLCDDVEISVSGNNSITHVVCDEMPDLPEDKNLCYKVVECLRSVYHFDSDVTVRIVKRIPSQAGLGGGSSDAATTASALVEMLGLDISNDELISLMMRFGSDIPYFFLNRPAILSGKGELIETIPISQKQLYCLLIKPEEGLSTKDIYSCCDDFKREKIDIDALANSLFDGDLESASRYFGNDLYPAALSKLPILRTIIEDLRRKELCLSGMTGSGSTLFALSYDEGELKRYKSLIDEKYWACLVKVI